MHCADSSWCPFCHKRVGNLLACNDTRHTETCVVHKLREETRMVKLYKSKANKVGTVTIRWKRDVEEWEVKTEKGSTYYTNDADDAIGTAKMMDRTA